MHTEPSEQRVAAGTAGRQPDLVETQDVPVRVRVGALAYFVERVHQRLEFLRQLGKYRRQHPSPAPCGRRGERRISAPAHGDVVVDVDEPGGEAAREEAGDEERHVAEALQKAVALGGARGLAR